MLKAVFFDFGNTIHREGMSIDAAMEGRVIRLMPGVREALEQISLPKGIWANTRYHTSAHIRDWLVFVGLDRYIEWITTSVELDCRKPDVEFFNRALAHSGVRPSEAVFVGNQLNTDILGGQRAGIRTVYLADPVYRSVDDMETPEARPTFTIQTLLELPELIGRLTTHQSEAGM